MRERLDERLENARVRKGRFGSDESYGANGAFMLAGPRGVVLRIIASDGRDPDAKGWEHVSVSISQRNRTPYWQEMCWVKDLFWHEEETVIQFHPPQSEYVNCHPTTLHLWRNKIATWITPPSILVGPK